MLATTITLLITATATAAAASWPAPRKWSAPHWWIRQALCIHHYEGAWNANTGNGLRDARSFVASIQRHEAVWETEAAGLLSRLDAMLRAIGQP